MAVEHAELPAQNWSPTKVRLAMIVVGLLQTCFVAFAVASSGFYQDDYLYFDLARKSGLTLNGMTVSVFGSIIPGFAFVNTLLSFGHPILRWQMAALLILFYVAIVVVFYRLLELIFGARPAIVAVTAIATSSGLLGVSLDWWTPGLNSLPAVAGGLLAFDGLARHALTGRRRYLVVSVVSFALAATFYDPGILAVVPLVLFTLLYLADPSNLRSLWTAIWTHIWVWVGYAVPIVANLGWRHLHPKEYPLPPVGSVSDVLRFMGTGWAQGFAPSSLGVNYPTLAVGSWRLGIVVLSQLLLVGVVVVSLVRRRRAWRAWLVFGAGFLVTDLVAGIGRSSVATALAQNSLYWVSFGFLFWFCFCLAFLPSNLSRLSISNPNPDRAPGRHSKPTRNPASFNLIALVITVALCVLGLRYIWTTPARAAAASNTSYIEHLRDDWHDVSAHDASAFIWNTEVPDWVLNSNFAPYNRLASTMGLVINGLRFDATDGPGYKVNAEGHLIPVTGQVVSRTIGGQRCVARASAPTTLGFPLTTPIKGYVFLRIQFTGSTGFNLQYYGGHVHLDRGDGSVLVAQDLPVTTSTPVFGSPPGVAACITVDAELPVPTSPH